MYNTEVFPEPPTSWNVVFEEQTLPDGESNAGRVQAYDGAIYIADAALYLKAHAARARHRRLVRAQPGAVRRRDRAARAAERAGEQVLARRRTSQIEDFTSGRTVASGTWPFQVNLLVADGAADRQRRARGGGDRLGRHDDARTPNAAHPNCAYKWMEWSLNPTVQGDVVGLVRRRAVGARSVRGQRTARPTRDARPTASTTSTRSRSGRHRRPTASATSPRAPACPYSEWVEEYQGILNM